MWGTPQIRYLPQGVDGSCPGIWPDMHNGRWLNHTAEAAGRAKGLDRRFVSLEQKLPEDWKPVPCSTAIRHQPLLLDGHHDAYPNHFVTQLWNTLRAMRLEMTKIIKDHDPSSEAAASETINSIARKMCHAVPQFMLPGSRPENAGPFSPMEKLQCRSLLSCLYLAAQLSADGHLREWTCACMEYMAERGEMRVARDIAGIIRGRMDVDYWTVGDDGVFCDGCIDVHNYRPLPVSWDWVQHIAGMTWAASAFGGFLKSVVVFPACSRFIGFKRIAFYRRSQHRVGRLARQGQSSTRLGILYNH